MKTFRYYHFEPSHGRAVCVRQFGINSVDHDEGGKKGRRACLERDTWNTPALNRLQKRTRPPASAGRTVPSKTAEAPRSAGDDGPCIVEAHHGLQDEVTKFGKLTGNQAIADLFACRMLLRRREQTADDYDWHDPDHCCCSGPSPSVGSLDAGTPKEQALRIVAGYMATQASVAAHGDAFDRQSPCVLGCSAHDSPWNINLTNVSTTCRSLRAILWPKRLDRLLIRPGENFATLESVISSRDRMHVRSVQRVFKFEDVTDHVLRHL